MTRIALKLEECCSWCRQPVQRCREASCDDSRTYSGKLYGGEWKETEEAESSRGAELLRAA